MTLLLSAPAISFWGIGTSDIGQDTLGWSKSGSAAALAVATLVIPGLDAFCANQREEKWLDKWSCKRWRFSYKANAAWVKEQGRRAERGEPKPAAKTRRLRQELSAVALTRPKRSPRPRSVGPSFLPLRAARETKNESREDNQRATI